MIAIDDLVEQVRDALGNLYDFSALEGHPLIAYLGIDEGLAPRAQMRALRSLVLETLDEMGPGKGEHLRSSERRSYHMINLHYVEGMTIEQAASELAISTRHAYRCLRSAERDLAVLLQSSLAQTYGSVVSEREANRVELVQREVQRVSDGAQDTDMAEFVNGVHSALGALCLQKHVRIETEVKSPRIVKIRSQIARQTLLGCLSELVQQSKEHSDMRVRVECGTITTRVSVYSIPAREQHPHTKLSPTIRHLALQLGGGSTQELKPNGRLLTCFTLWHRSSKPSLDVLLIDDNQGLADLFERYLDGTQFRLVAATGGTQGMAMITESLPDVIILDVMMPTEDGWSILQRFRNTPTVRDIPILVCSVLNDPELAFSLQASAFLAKPVSRSQLLSALSRCCQSSELRQDSSKC